MLNSPLPRISNVVLPVSPVCLNGSQVVLLAGGEMSQLGTVLSSSHRQYVLSTYGNLLNLKTFALLYSNFTLC
jgi:hypothetical protein